MNPTSRPTATMRSAARRCAPSSHVVALSLGSRFVRTSPYESVRFPTKGAVCPMDGVWKRIDAPAKRNAEYHKDQDRAVHRSSARCLGRPAVSRPGNAPIWIHEPVKNRGDTGRVRTRHVPQRRARCPERLVVFPTVSVLCWMFQHAKPAEVSRRGLLQPVIRSPARCRRKHAVCPEVRVERWIRASVVPTWACHSDPTAGAKEMSVEDKRTGHANPTRHATNADRATIGCTIPHAPRAQTTCPRVPWWGSTWILIV